MLVSVSSSIVNKLRLSEPALGSGASLLTLVHFFHYRPCLLDRLLIIHNHILSGSLAYCVCASLKHWRPARKLVTNQKSALYKSLLSQREAHFLQTVPHFSLAKLNSHPMRKVTQGCNLIHMESCFSTQFHLSIITWPHSLLNQNVISGLKLHSLNLSYTNACQERAH